MRLVELGSGFVTTKKLSLDRIRSFGVSFMNGIDLHRAVGGLF